MRKNYLFTSESVSEGHPDKVADQISDSLVDSYLKIDPCARLGIETAVTTNKVVVLGEINVNGKKLSNEEIKQIVRNTVKEIGYEQDGFHHEKKYYFILSLVISLWVSILMNSMKVKRVLVTKV